MKKKQILITSVHMGLGGIESVLINFLNNINYKKYDVDLVLYKNTGINLKKIPKEVKVFSPYSYQNKSFLSKLTSKDKTFNKIIRKITFNKITLNFYIKKKQYDIGIAFAGYHYLMDLLVAHSNCNKKYIWIHTDIEYLFNNNEVYKAKFLKTKNKYDNFDKIIAVSESAMLAFTKICPEFKNKVNYIWNVMPTTVSKERIKFNTKTYNIVSVGRLESQKGYERIIDVAKILSKEKQAFHIYILGDGSKKSELLEKLSTKKMFNYVTFLGAQNNVYKYLNSADLFLSTSYYEGFCTAIIESLLCSTPVVAPKVTGIVDIAKDLAPDNSFILTENNIDSMVKGVKNAINGKVNKNFKFDTKKINKQILAKYEKLLEGKI